MPEAGGLDRPAETEDIDAILDFLRDNRLASRLESITLFSSDHASRRNPDSLDSEHECQCSVDNAWLWEKIFANVDPVRFTIIAHPRLIGAVLSTCVDLTNAWRKFTPASRGDPRRMIFLRPLAKLVVNLLLPPPPPPFSLKRARPIAWG